MNQSDYDIILKHYSECPYKISDLLARLTGGAMISAGQARWLAGLGIEDERISKALEIQDPETRTGEFLALAERFFLTNRTLGEMLHRSPQTISQYGTGRIPVPVDVLSKLRRIVAGIEDVIR